MKRSDVIAEFIRQLMDAENGRAKIKRNELALQLGCVPSQINYVITSRFTPEQGYLVESQRGGGGYILITRIQTTERSHIMHVVNSVGTNISETDARLMIESLFYNDLLTKKTAALMLRAVVDQSLRQVEPPVRDQVRATLLKQLLVVITEDWEG